MNCVKKVLEGVVKSSKTKRALAWIVAASLAFTSLTNTSFAENTDEEELVIVDVSDDVDDSGEDNSSEDASTEDQATEDSAEEEVIIIGEEEDDEAVTETSTVGYDAAASFDSSSVEDEGPEVTIKKTFTYTGEVQKLTKADLVVKNGEDVIPDDGYDLLGDTEETDAGDYEAYIWFKDAYEDLDPVTVEWEIAALEISIDLSKVKETETYSAGKTCEEHKEALLDKIIEGKLITIKAGGKDIDAEDVGGLELTLTDKNKETVSDDTVPDAGDYSVVINEKSLDSNYSVKACVPGKYSIGKKDISGCEVVDPEDEDFERAFTGEDIEIDYTVIDGSNALDVDEEFVVDPSSKTKAKEVGTYSVRIKGKGNYKGTKEFTWSIKKKVDITVGTFVYDGTIQDVRDELLVTSGGKPLVEKTDYTVAADTQKNVGKYKFTVTFIGKYSEFEPRTLDWEILPLEISVDMSDAKYSVNYSATAKGSQFVEAVFKKMMAAKSDKIVINDGEVDAASVEGLAIKILDSHGTAIPGDKVPDAGNYTIALDEDKLSTNYKVNDVEKGSLEIKKIPGKAEVTLNGSYEYSDTIKSNFKSSDYTKATWAVYVGKSLDDSEEVKESSDSVKMGEVKLGTFDVNETGESYFLVVTFTDPDSSKLGPNYEDSIEVKKAFKVTAKSIKSATMGSADPEPADVKNESAAITLIYNYTSSSFAPDIETIKIGDTTLKADEDFTMPTVTTHAGSTSDLTYTFNLTGKGNYTGQRTIKWTIRGSNSGSQKDTTATLTFTKPTSGSVTAVSSTRLSNYIKKKKTDNPKGKKLEYTLKVNAIDRSAISQEAENIISNLNDASVVVECYDITINEKITDLETNAVDAKDLTSFDTAIDVALTLGRANSSQNLLVIREHGGSTAEMVRLDSVPSSEATEGYYVSNGKVTIYSRFFSNYTLVYTSNGNSGAAIGGGGDDSGVNGGSRAPRTGDNLPVVWIWAVILLAGVILISFAAYGSLRAKKVVVTETTKKKRCLDSKGHSF